MRNSVFAVVVMGILFGAGQARAESRRVELVWRELTPWTGADAPVQVQHAVVDGATVGFQRFRDGKRLLAIRYESGVECSTVAAAGEVASLTCGTPDARYSLVQAPSGQTQLEWSRR